MIPRARAIPSRRCRSAWKLWLVLGLLLLSFVSLLASERILAVLRGEQDLAGNRKYTPRHGPQDLEGVDLRLVHSELLPSWLIAAANLELTGARRANNVRFAALHEGVAADANLVAIVDEMKGLVDEPVENADRLLYLAWAWNDYLGSKALPWRIDANVLIKEGSGFYYAKCYEVMTDLRIMVAEHSHRVRILTRVDHTNVREGYLGHASKHKEGALILVDRIWDFTIDHVWPLLDPVVKQDLDELERAFAPHIRREMKRALPTKTVGVLVETARHRHDIVRAVDSIRARHSCGSTFVVNTVPWNGWSDDDLGIFNRYARRTGHDDCPKVTPRESLALSRSSDALRSADDLEEAVEMLVAWVARGTTVHELRHVADDEEVAGEWKARLSCEPCLGLPARGIEEMSAYLASFAHSDARNVSLYQACRLVEDGPHLRAREIIEAEMRGDCYEPPNDLAAQAADLEMSLLGRSDIIELPDDYPVALSLPAE